MSIIMATCIGVLLLAGIVDLLSVRGEHRKETVRSMSCYAEIIGDNCKAALAFEDAEDAKQTLKSLQAESSIAFACVYTKEGKVLAHYQHPDVTDEFSPPVCKKEGYQFDNNYFKLFKQVENNNEIIGTVYIQLDLGRMKAMLWLEAGTTALVVLVCSLVAYLVSLRLQRVISGPILGLAEVAKAVSEKKEYSTRAPKQSNDEVGLFTDAFNEMLEQIQQRDSELVKAKLQLETKVHERTKELTNANEQLEASVVHANQLAEKAVAADKAKSEFLANMSHEIRTPMNAIIGFSQILAEENFNEEQKEYVNIIQNSGTILLKLINDILDFSKIEADKLDIEFTDCRLDELLTGIESMMYQKAEQKGLEFHIARSDALPAWIRTDLTRLHQCLVNLTGNAIKFTETGHVYVNVSLERDNDKPFIRFDVEDNGVGIPPDKQDEIFESFTQADGSTTRKFGGTGLGLTITKRLAELLDGNLTLTSEVGRGSVFTLAIPAGVDISSQPALDGQDTSSKTTEEQRQLKEPRFCGRLLIAEDVLTNQMLIKLMLEKMGLEVTIANDGKEAVDKALSNPFDLIFMDIQMPNMNGYEATKALREKGLKTPIVALTANAMKGDDKKCIEAGCDDYMSKPIDRGRLIEVMSKYLQTSPAESS